MSKKINSYTNIFRPWTLRHWLFDHWNWYQTKVIKLIQEYQSAMLTYRRSILWRGVQMSHTTSDKIETDEKEWYDKFMKDEKDKLDLFGFAYDVKKET